MKQVAVYGGTFDPIHIGHQWLIEYCLNNRRFDEVIVLVEPQPRHKEPVASLQDRIAMIRLLFADEPRVSVNPFEMSQDAHTVAETLAEVSEYTPDSEITLVMGGDVFEYVPQWPGITEALSDLKFVIALRTEDDGEIAVGLLSDDLAGAAVHMVATEVPKASSSKIRASLSEGEQTDLISEEVAAYIAEHDLYG